jgi:hypothetical protein
MEGSTWAKWPLVLGFFFFFFFCIFKVLFTFPPMVDGGGVGVGLLCLGRLGMATVCAVTG